MTNAVDILSWILFGLVAGSVAHLIDPADVNGGVVGTVLTGIVGSLLGGAVAYYLFGFTVNGFNLTSLAIAVVGAIAFSFLYRLFLRKGRQYNNHENFGLKGGRSRRREY